MARSDDMTLVAPAGKKAAIWLACKPKTCCYTAIVVPTGRDVWRIARSLEAPPWTFLKYFPTPVARRDGFLLDRSERQFRLALGKQPSRRRKLPAPCIFLLRTRSGHHRCGLGDLRPRSCHCFPSEMRQGILSVRNDAGCTCRSWSLADVDIAEETALVKVREAEAVEYYEVVARWNDRVLEAPEGTTFTFLDYCEYLLEAYDAIDAPRIESS